MPIYMDRHDVSEEVTAEIVAQLHREDLKIQHKYNCKGLTYWFDGKRKTAFCLVEAPNKEAIKEMHDNAHGEVPHRIIKVDERIVESFLGRIEDPEKSENTELNIINDPAFRTIMVTTVKIVSFKESTPRELKGIIQDHNRSMAEIIQKFEGRIVKQGFDYFLTSFKSVTNAVTCAMHIQRKLGQTFNGSLDRHLKLNISLSAGVPVTEKESIFEDTIKLAERLCEAAQGRIVISSEVRDLYESEHLNISVDHESIDTLEATDERFLNLLMDYIDYKWNDNTLNSNNLSKKLGYSKSQFYRKMIATMGESPMDFVHKYRLNKALKLLDKKKENISEIAFETGFNSPAYFSKCFFDKFGILPSKYIRDYI